MRSESVHPTPVSLSRVLCHLVVLWQFLLLAILGRFAPLHAQDASDIIRGRVIGPDKKPIENVTVTATSLVNQTSRTAKTNKDGRFSIIFSGGGGDYMMAYVDDRVSADAFRGEARGRRGYSRCRRDAWARRPCRSTRCA